MNQRTERNLEMWREFQHNLTGAMGRPAAGGRTREKPGTPGKPREE